MSIKTGKTPLGAGAVAAILSLSLVVNLPGLAVTPMLGTLQSIFPDTTQLEKQLLTLLPNLLIIPCLLISGRLSLLRCKIAIVTGALVVYTLCGVAYLFASSMTELIVISCILGIGAGILIPFSTGLIADTFAGDVRMKEMGYQSAISNLTLVIATYAVGVLSHGNWHLPFVVYLIPIIPLALTPLLRRIPAADLYDSAATPAAKQQQPHGGFIMSRMIAVIGVYFFVTYSVIIISYYCPFLMEKEHWSAALTGAVTAVFFFFTFVPGTAVDQIVRAQGRNAARGGGSHTYRAVAVCFRPPAVGNADRCRAYGIRLRSVSAYSLQQGADDRQHPAQGNACSCDSAHGKLYFDSCGAGVCRCLPCVIQRCG